MTMILSLVQFLIFFFIIHLVTADVDLQHPIAPVEKESLESWLDAEKERALQSILDNIGSNGSYAFQAYPGVVVASPSKNDPNCTSTFPCVIMSCG